MKTTIAFLGPSSLSICPRHQISSHPKARDLVAGASAHAVPLFAVKNSHALSAGGATNGNRGYEK